MDTETLKVLGAIGCALLGFLTAMGTLVAVLRFLVHPVVQAAIAPLDKQLGELKAQLENANKQANSTETWQRGHEQHDDERFEKMLGTMRSGFDDIGKQLTELKVSNARAQAKRRSA